MKKLICTFLGIGLLTACVEDAPKNPDPIEPGINRVWIVNEGNFNAGNATLGIYDLDSSTYSASVFAATNNRPLGDVFHSALQIENEVYLVVNNSGKIEVVNKENFESTGTITGFTSPRYMVQVSPTMAYVSDLVADSIAVVDLVSKKIDHYIQLGHTSGQMLVAEGKVFITYEYVGGVSVVDIGNENVRHIPTIDNPAALEKDSNGKIWLLCGGNSNQVVMGALQVIDPISEKIEKTISLDYVSYTNHLAFNGKKDSIYVLMSDVYKISVENPITPAAPFIKSFSGNLYGMAYRESDNTLWIADSRGFSQKGEVSIYSSKGKLKSSFTAGVGTSGFLFEEN